MKIRGRRFGKKFAPLHMKDGDEGGEGGSGGGGGTTFTQEQVDTMVQEKVDVAVFGLKAKNTELIGNLKDTQKIVKSWEGLDPENVRNLMDKLEGDEVLKLHAEGKHDDAYNKRMETERATHQSKVDGIVTERDTLAGDLEKSRSQVRDLIIDQQVITSFMMEKGLETAAPDVVLRAKATFTIEDGVAIARDGKGEIIRGKEGPITIPEWVTSLKTSAGHLFPGSHGAGAEGSGGRGGSDLASQLIAAADKGDMVEYKRLRKEADKQKTGS